MAYKLLNGKDLAARMKAEMSEEVKRLADNGITPGLAVIIVGNDPASRIYVNSKKRDCAEVGIRSFEYALPEDTKEEELLGLIDALNQDEAVDGILVQLPFRSSDEAKVIAELTHQDVDAFHPFNEGAHDRKHALHPVPLPVSWSS